MAKHPQSKRHQNRAEEHNQQAGRKESVSDMGTPPHGNPPNLPKGNRNNGEYSPTPGQVLRYFVLWLRGFHWSREKAKATDWIMVGLTLLVALAAIGSAWIFNLQLQESHRTTIISQRAFISFSPNIDTFYNSTGDRSNDIKSWQFLVPLKNTGTTFTQSFRDHVIVLPSEQELPEGFNFEDFQHGEAAFVAPQDHISYVTEPVPVGTLAEVKNHSKHLYIYGWASYRDVFGESILPHVTEFCYEMSPPGGDFTKTNGGYIFHFNLCRIHNCADKECTDQKAN